MRFFIILTCLWFCFSESVFSQANRSSNLYGVKGLMVTEQVLAELDLPAWCWGGAHVYENVERNYRSIGGPLLKKYIGGFPVNGLNDPQDFLNEDQREKIKELIAAHDMKSAIPVYVNVLANGQNMLMQEYELTAALEHHFKGKNAFVIYFYYGYARGVKGYVLLDNQGMINDWEVEELFLKSARDASVPLENFAQLESFVRNFSKRSFWLEQRLITPVRAVKNDKPEKDKQKNQDSWNKWLLILTDNTLTVVLSLWVLAGGAWYYLWSRKWRKYVLPDYDVPVRLGADYGANISDTIEFADSKVSLTNQYEKIKNREL